MAAMDYEALKEQWSDVEERDGVRLSWNVFPSSRMVGFACRLWCILRPELTDFTGGFSTRGTDWSLVHALEGEARVASLAVRASDVQATVPLCPEPVLVSLPSRLLCSLQLTSHQPG